MHLSLVKRLDAPHHCGSSRRDVHVCQHTPTCLCGTLRRQTAEAAPLRCLSDVVDAGDRIHEIEIAEDCTCM